MPSPSFLKDFGDRVITYKRNVPPINEFLRNGNVFWYKLPQGYHDQGPKVIMEAQASGLPIIAENNSGAMDRVVDGSGILCNSLDDHINAMKNLLDEDLRIKMGSVGRAHSTNNYGYEKWIEELRRI
jgi:glycosyltransferase involved in cell wall biosynthesis